MLTHGPGDGSDGRPRRTTTARCAASLVANRRDGGLNLPSPFYLILANSQWWPSRAANKLFYGRGDGTGMENRRPLVLIVEDDPDNLQEMAGFLETLPVRIELASDGVRGLDLIRRLKPSAVVLDLMLPGISGARVLAEMRAERIDVPVVLVSGVVKSPALGATLDFLPKPCHPDAFREAVLRAIVRSADTDDGV